MQPYADASYYPGSEMVTELKKLEVPRDRYDGRLLTLVLVNFKTDGLGKWYVTVGSIIDKIGGFATDNFGEIMIQVETLEEAGEIADSWIRSCSEFVPGRMKLGDGSAAFYVIR